MIIEANSRLRRRRRKRRIRFAIFVSLVVVVSYLLFARAKPVPKKTTILSPLGTSQKVAPSTVLSSENNSASLKAAVLAALDGSTGTYAVVIKNLKTNEYFTLNEHKVFESGSLYKLWVMAVVYNQLNKGTLKMDQELIEDVADINEKFQIDPNYAEQTTGTIDESVNDALSKMITISDNYSALILADTVHLSQVSAFLKDNGFKESAVGVDGKSPTTTASDVALFFEKLYKGQLADKETTAAMLTLLKQQRLNDKLPKYLPKDLVVAHKTGEIDWATHDGGIVYGPTGDYIIVVLSNSDFPAGAEEYIANISKNVYNYFSQQKN